MTKKNQESNRERKKTKTKTKKSKSYNIYIFQKHIRIKKNLIIKQLTCGENIEVTHTKNVRMESN